MSSAESLSAASDEVAETVQQISVVNQDQKERIDRFAEDLHAVATTLADVPEDDLDPAVRSHLDTIRALCDDLDGLTAASEETLAEAQNLAAAAAEQTSALMEVSNSATDLHEYAGPLGTELDRFETDADSQFMYVAATSSED